MPNLRGFMRVTEAEHEFDNYVEALEAVARAAREYATVTNQGWPVPRQVAEATQKIRDALNRLDVYRGDMDSGKCNAEESDVLDAIADAYADRATEAMNKGDAVNANDYREKCDAARWAARRLRHEPGKRYGGDPQYDYENNLPQWATADVAAMLEKFAEDASFDHAFHTVLREAAGRLRRYQREREDE